MLKAMVILFAALAIGLTACKSINSTDLKDDILVKDQADAKLYWVVGDEGSQQVCRSSCDMATIKVQGNIEETRGSCNRESTESIDAAIFAGNQDLAGVYSVFFQSLSPNKVAVLSSDAGSDKVKAANLQRVSLINTLFNDDNMYLDSAARKLRDQGLASFGQDKVVRFDPRCFASNVVGSQIAVEKEPENNQEPAKEEPKVVFDSTRSIEIPEVMYGGIVWFLKKTMSPYDSAYKVWSTSSQGNDLLWFSKDNKQPFLKLTLGSDRGPALFDDKGALSKYLSIEKSEAASMWAEFLAAISKISQKQIGTQMIVTFEDGVGYTIKTAQVSGNFSSPGVPQYHSFYLRTFVQSAQNKFYLQFDPIPAAN